MNLKDFNCLEEGEARGLLRKLCGSSFWVEEMNNRRPYDDLASMLGHAELTWFGCHHADWLEAFEQHPRIGDITSLREKFMATKDWAQHEQAGVSRADEQVIRDLAELNETYFRRFGFIFIVNATGKTAIEMRDLLAERLENNQADELEIAAREQMKITKLRINKLFDNL